MLRRPSALPPIVDHEVVDEMRDMLGDQFPALYDRFANDTQALLSTIEFSRASGDVEGIRDAVHSLKSSSFQMGAARVSYHAHHIEVFMNRDKPLTSIRDEGRLDTMIDKLRQAYMAYQNDISDT